MAEPSETTFWTILGGAAAVLGFGGLAAWYFQETLKRILPAPLRSARWLRTRDIVPSEGTHFTILIADLDGDDDQLSQTKHVEAALRDQQGLEVVLVGPGPKPFEKGSRAEHQIRAENQAREKLAYHNGDLLIWGEVAQANLRVRLRFLPRQEGVEGSRGNYQLEAAELPKDFGEDFNAQLIALTLASLAPATEERGVYLVDLLKGPLGKLERFFEKGAPGLDPEEIAELQLALGNAAHAIGKQSNDSDSFWKAVAAYRVALAQSPREQRPMAWAKAQNNLSNALLGLGERAPDTALLEEAVAAARAALEEVARERAPPDWAIVQTNLGNALLTLGSRKATTTLLEEAVTAFQAALEEITRERVPLDWAMIQNNLGLAILRLGERETATTRLKEAVEVFRAALEEWTRERVPLLWAAI